MRDNSEKSVVAENSKSTQNLRALGARVQKCTKDEKVHGIFYYRTTLGKQRLPGWVVKNVLSLNRHGPAIETRDYFA